MAPPRESDSPEPAVPLTAEDLDTAMTECPEPCPRETEAVAGSMPIDESVEAAGDVIREWVCDPSKGGPEDMLRAALLAALYLEGRGE